MFKKKSRLKVENVTQRTAQASWALFLLRALPLIIALVLIYFSIAFLHKKLYYDNEFFQLQKIEAKAGENFSYERIITILSEQEIEPGKGTLPSLPIAEIRQRFLLEPMIADVKVRRIYPGTLRIEISERIPIAILHFLDKNKKIFFHKIDKNAIILPDEIRGGPITLPLVNRIPMRGNISLGEKTDNHCLLAVVQLLNQLAMRPEAGLYDIVVIQVNDKDRHLVLYLNAKGKLFKQSAQIVIPMDKISEALDKLKTICDARLKTGQTISYIDVTLKDNIPVIK